MRGIASTHDIAPARAFPATLPEWARYIATDDNGEAWLFAEMPRFDAQNGLWLPTRGDFTPMPAACSVVSVCEPTLYTRRGNGTLLMLAARDPVEAAQQRAFAPLLKRMGRMLRGMPA